MNASCDTAPVGREKIDRMTEQITPAEQPGQIFRRILVGTDFSSASFSAFEQGLKLAKQNKAELLVAHSAATPGWIGFMPTESFGEWEIYQKTEAEKNIGALILKARKEGVNAHMLLLTGPANDAIIDAAKRLGVDLIVIGTHGRRGVSRLLMGSVASCVVSRAPCAVLTARCPNQIEP
jgi:nucleotide-binding universal stress UspA family protein